MAMEEVWERLSKVRGLYFEAKSRSTTNTGWTGTGRGTVKVEKLNAGVILFHEQGFWTSEQGREFGFNNVFRWTIDSDEQSILLEHLRFGTEQPVYLFDFLPVSEQIMESSTPHVCRDDCYAARLECGQELVRLSWRITGPEKDETISYSYR